ncbi:MAG: class I SAM-dependent methyltransferase [Eubacteriales bacterium]|nr:class I SAM-dependent methyltransferase [Eubacteriales bacterium]
MMIARIDKRLKAVAENVPFCKKVADIGTDHALIPIYLVRNGVCAGAIATDLKEGPIEAAKRNISKYGMNEHIEVRIGSGLSVIKENEVDAVIIAGMGGVLISNILENDLRKAKTVRDFILQPNYAVDYLRKWLYNNGFDIYDEDLAKERSKIYNIIKARWNGELQEKTEFQYLIGEKLIKKKHDLINEFIENQIKVYSKIENGLNKASNNSEYIQKELQKTVETRKQLEDLLYREVCKGRD